MKLKKPVIWIIIWSFISLDVMVCWKASESVVKGSRPVSTTQVGHQNLSSDWQIFFVESKLISFSEWKQRYAILNPNAVPKGALMQPKNACEKILAGITEINADSYRFGHTKVQLLIEFATTIFLF